jgi:hypothetical protein
MQYGSGADAGAQYGSGADAGAQMPRISGDGKQCLGCRAE